MYKLFQDLEENDTVLYNITYRYPLIEEVVRYMETYFLTNLRKETATRLKRFFSF